MAKYWSSQIRLYWAGRDVGTATRSWTVGLEAEALDRTAFTHTAELMERGVRKDTFEWAGMFDDDVSMNHAMGTMVGTGTDFNNAWSILFGTATGNRAYAGTAIWTGAKPKGEVRGLAMFDGDWRMDDKWDVGVHYGVPKGWSGTAGGDSVSGTTDNGASSTNGLALYIQVLDGANDSGTINFRIQDSPDATTWSNIDPNYIISTANYATGTVISGTIARYLRWNRNLGSVGTRTAAIVTARR